ncbi:hypothetical protein TGAM01_v210489 [Trichoderma gamsii]|uniref:AA1-like domain-containing protein n=1 Tax=Trichoderma gamsii TaxID=398673 RepID=A0A2P4Z8J7_9HYPO|nr:hypothetical protein TGAM01_v210489 [Trichoderma gamsii]PON20615.1 hypothetical protein TGAM01_v210489 [Trichoderma gamsii]
MKASTGVYGLAAAAFASLASAASPYWYITTLRTFETTSTTFASSLQFNFEDASISLITTCKYANAPGSGRPATVLTPTACENPQVKFTYIQTSHSTGQISITLEHLNGAGNLQGVQNGTGIADLACQQEESQSGTTCYAENTEIIPGTEAGSPSF